jgi:hypothetical protein
MANKRIKKPLTQRLSIYEQEYKLKQEAKEILKKIKEYARYNTLQRN